MQLELTTPTLTPTHVAASDAAAETRWRAWKARGVAADRRSASNMRRLLILVATGFAVWVAVQMF
jgi:hypothetical protein